MKFTDDELVAAIESEEAMALDITNGELSRERWKALERYRGAPIGNEVEGRSQVVDKSVLDTIEWIMPSLVRVYMGGDEIGCFEPIGPQDEAAAEAETEVCNWYLHQKNDYFSQINATLRDALLLKNGYIVAYWNMRYDTMVERYKGLADEEAAMLMQDPEVNVVEHDEYPDPNAPSPEQMQMMMAQMVPPGSPPPQLPPPPQLHDVVVERKTCEEYPAVESVPPDEMIISRAHRWTSLADADFVQWRRRVSVGQLRSEGFDIPDDVPSDEDFTPEEFARERFQESTEYYDVMSPDPARRIVIFKDTYIRMDLRGTGMPQLWRICVIHGSRQIVRKEQVDIVPFAAFSPIVYPHSHIGSSVYDLIDDISLIKTTVMRNYIDSLGFATAPRVAVDINRATALLDDLIVSRPGGIIRIDGPPGDALLPLTMPDVGAAALQGLEWLSSVNEERTGVTRYSAGLDPNVLNKTATGIQMLQSGANQRIELIARTLAGGFRDLFLIIHALALKHSTKALQMKMKGSWVTIDPREWKKRTDFRISVGLGTGSPETQLTKLQMLQPDMQLAMQAGLAGPEEIYNYICERFKAAGFQFADKFIHEPAKDAQGNAIAPPQQPNPLVQAEQIKAQAQMQATQAKVQADAAADQARAQADMAIQQQKIQSDAEFQLAKAKMQLQFDDLRHSREQQTQIQIANINAAAKVEAARIAASVDPGDAVLRQEMAGS